MAKKKVCLVVGTRPEAIKMAPIHRRLLQSDRLAPILLSTGQHREMLQQALAVFDIQPDCDLALMQASQTLPDLTARAITAVSAFLERERPDALLVQGDTTTVLAGALAAAYAKIPVGHVEAGLRTGNMESPWPEELNRRLVSPLCKWNFVPTETSRQNLVAERIDPQSCFVTGNSVVDALLWARQMVAERGESTQDMVARLGIPADFATQSGAATERTMILVTGHRRESFGSGFESVCSALRSIADQHPGCRFVFPVHLNPAAREPVHQALGDHPQFALIEPVGYLEMVWLMEHAKFIISDSGGVQEEAPSLGTPVLVTRDTTERPEGVEAGTCRLVGTDPLRIQTEACELIENVQEFQRRSEIANPYGDGKTADRICSILENAL